MNKPRVSSRMEATDSKSKLALQDFANAQGASISAPNRNGDFQKSYGIQFRLVKFLLGRLGDLPVSVVLPNGQKISPSNANSVGTIVIRDARTIWGLVVDPIYQFGEAYADGRIEIEGDMAGCLTAIYRVMNQTPKYTFAQKLMVQFHRPHTNTKRRAKCNIHHHYDIGNDFYRLWLDEKLVYTCAFFAKPNYTLEQAQIAKMDLVCRKLRLKPGLQVVEAGCGWGALAIHMAKNFGVRVKAFNISREQIALARENAILEGVAGQVEFVQDDWRNIQGHFDAFVSVGMLEHVGLSNFQHLGQKIKSILKPDGIGLIHSIGQNIHRPMNPWIERRIFPGAYTPTLREMMDIFETGYFSVLDVENLRLHYAETLRHWLHRFEQSIEPIRIQFGETFIRTWRMYLAGSVAAFESGCMQLFQVVFANGTSNNVPLTRDHLFGTTTNVEQDERFQGVNDYSRMTNPRRAK